MKLTIREALTIEPLDRARVLAGRAGLDNAISAVNVMEVPDILDWVHPGELLVTTLYPLQDNTSQIQRLVRQLAEKQLAGLGIKPYRYIGEIPAGLLADANELAFPILELPADISFIEVIHPITSRILELRTSELLRSEKIHRQFLDIVLSGGGFAEIANALTELIRSPVTIVDQFRKVLADGHVFGLDHPQSHFIDHDNRGDKYLSQAYQPKLLNNWTHREATQMSIEIGNDQVNLVRCLIKTGSLTLGEIIVWRITDSPLDAIDLIAIESGATITALKMLERRSVNQVEQRFSNEILLDLLSDDKFACERAIQKAFQLGYKLSAPFAIILVGSDVHSDTLLSFEEQNHLEASLYAARRHIRAFNPQGVFWYKGPRLVVFFPVKHDQVTESKDFITKELERISRYITTRHIPFTVSFGISGINTDLADFRQGYDSAKQALDIGRIISTKEQGIITHYDDLGVFRTIALTTGQSGIQGFCQDTLGSILEYDQRHGTELLETLRVYLDCNQNATQAAKALFIHYNTLRYRLNCITDILGDVLDDTQKRLAIEVALQIYPLLQQRIE